MTRTMRFPLERTTDLDERNTEIAAAQRQFGRRADGLYRWRISQLLHPFPYPDRDAGRVGEARVPMGHLQRQNPIHVGRVGQPTASAVG